MEDVFAFHLKSEHFIQPVADHIVRGVRPTEVVPPPAAHPCLKIGIPAEGVLPGAPVLEGFQVGAVLLVLHHCLLPPLADVLPHGVGGLGGGARPPAVDELFRLGGGDHVEHVLVGPPGHADVLVVQAVDVDVVDDLGVVLPFRRPVPGGGVAVQDRVLFGPGVGEIVERQVAQGLQHRLALDVEKLVEAAVIVAGVIGGRRVLDAEVRPRYLAVEVVPSFHEELAEPGAFRGPGVVVAVLAQDDVHGVVVGPDPDLLHAHLLGHGGGDPVHLGHLDEPVGHLVEPGHHLDGGELGGDHRLGHDTGALHPGVRVDGDVPAGFEHHVGGGVQPARVKNLDVSRSHLIHRDGAREEFLLRPGGVHPGVDLDLSQGIQRPRNDDAVHGVEQDPLQPDVGVQDQPVDPDTPAEEMNQQGSFNQGGRDIAVGPGHVDGPAGGLQAYLRARRVGLHAGPRQEVYILPGEGDGVPGAHSAGDGHGPPGRDGLYFRHLGGEHALVQVQLANRAVDDDVVLRPQGDPAADGGGEGAPGQAHGVAAPDRLGAFLEEVAVLVHIAGQVAGIAHHRAIARRQKIAVLVHVTDQVAVIVDQAAVFVQVVAVGVGLQDQGLQHDTGPRSVGPGGDGELFPGANEPVHQDQGVAGQGDGGALAHRFHQAVDPDIVSRDGDLPGADAPATGGR